MPTMYVYGFGNEPKFTMSVWEQKQMKSFYLAASLERQQEIATYAEQLRAAGYVVTSRWLDSGYVEKIRRESPKDGFSCRMAQIDLEDIASADTFVLFTRNESASLRGGKHFESGYACRAGKTMIVLEGLHNIFHWLPATYHMPGFGSLLYYLGENSDSANPVSSKLWWITPSLRFRKVLVHRPGSFEGSPGTDEQERHLQQAWMSPDGEVEWRDVILEE